MVRARARLRVRGRVRVRLRLRLRLRLRDRVLMGVMTWSARVLVPKPQLAYECFSELFCALTALGEWYMPGPGTCSQ